MSEDTLRRYGVSPRIGQAVMNVLERMSEREGANLPSSEVIAKALKVLGTDPKDRGVSRSVAPAIVYRVPSSSTPGRVHLVVLYMQETTETVIDAECSCKATSVCWHLLTALTYAENNGYHLDTGREVAE